jgi:hypothetical protein
MIQLFSLQMKIKLGNVILSVNILFTSHKRPVSSSNLARFAKHVYKLSYIDFFFGKGPFGQNALTFLFIRI